jgi:propionyl-CoA carboxylase alpha chain
MDRAALLSGQVPSHERKVPLDWVVVINKLEHPLKVAIAPGGYEVLYNGKSYTVLTSWKPGEPLVRASVNGKDVCFQLIATGASYQLFRRGAQINVLVCTPRAAELNRHMLDKVPPDLSRFLLSPMPGLLVKLTVKVGDEIKAGEELAVVEAMKMENSLRAVNDVVVAKILAKQGSSLMVDQPILEFE